jgi:hypothetical protein
MAQEINASMPDPDDNIQLGEGAVPPAELLGGDISTVFTYRPDQTGFDHALAAVKADQEAMCGYELAMKDHRETQLADEEGKINEVFVTFSPVGTYIA